MSARSEDDFFVRGRALLAFASAFVALACSGPSDSGVFAIVPPPGPPAFNAVSDALELHCGTLNCHGTDGRNMRLFGHYGLRLDPKDRTGLSPTTDAEYQANFESIISIEPEKLSQIVLSGGANEAKWIVISKGRAIEHHKGGARLVQGDAADTCLTSWIVAKNPAPTVNAPACAAAVVVAPPGADWTQ